MKASDGPFSTNLRRRLILIFVVCSFNCVFVRLYHKLHYWNALNAKVQWRLVCTSNCPRKALLNLRHVMWQLAILKLPRWTTIDF